MRAARVRQQELHRRRLRDLDHRALDDLERRLLLVRHLERLDELAAEVAALRLAVALLLAPDAIGDVTRVHHDAPAVPVAAKVGPGGPEANPVPRAAPQPESE